METYDVNFDCDQLKEDQYDSFDRIVHHLDEFSYTELEVFESEREKNEEVAS